MSAKSPLEKYIENHYRLIAAIDVFAALTAFFIRENIQYLAIITLFISAVLTWELLTSFKGNSILSIETPFRIIVFKMLLILLLVSIAWFFFETLAKTYYLKVFVASAGMGLMLFVVAKIIQKYKLFDSNVKSSKRIVGIILMVIVIFVFEFVLLISDDFLDSLMKLFS